MKLFKSIFLVVIALTLSTSFTSCVKDGTFTETVEFSTPLELITLDNWSKVIDPMGETFTFEKGGLLTISNNTGLHTWNWKLSNDGKSLEFIFPNKTVETYNVKELSRFSMILEHADGANQGDRIAFDHGR